MSQSIDGDEQANQMVSDKSKNNNSSKF